MARDPSSKQKDFETELNLIACKIKVVKEAGHGEVVIKIADGKVVHITQSISQQIK